MNITIDSITLSVTGDLDEVFPSYDPAEGEIESADFDGCGGVEITTVTTVDFDVDELTEDALGGLEVPAIEVTNIDVSTYGTVIVSLEG